MMVDGQWSMVKEVINHQPLTIFEKVLDTS
jgi:hypothetical protein